MDLLLAFVDLLVGDGEVGFFLVVDGEVGFLVGGEVGLRVGDGEAMARAARAPSTTRCRMNFILFLSAFSFA